MAAQQGSLIVHEAMGCCQKSFKLVWWCHQLLSGFLSKGHLLQISRLSVIDKDDNEMIPRTVHRSLGIYLAAEEKPKNFS